MTTRPAKPAISRPRANLSAVAGTGRRTAMSSEYLVLSGRRPVLKIEFIRSAVGKRSYRYPAILQPASNPLISLARVSGNRLSRAVLQAEYRTLGKSGPNSCRHGESSVLSGMRTSGKQRIVLQRLMGESIRKRLRAFFTLLRRNGWRGNENCRCTNRKKHLVV